ncbi:MAG: hypothetical protein JNL01_12780 [Bdellovibrionales bacterium]|nr:hypothetical protein [Bdellovibrionales bacterium]
MVPAAFREFLPFVSTSALKVIHKERVLAIALKSAAQTLNDSRYLEAIDLIRKQVEASALNLPVRVAVDPKDGIELAAHLQTATPENRKVIGETILQLYFLMVEYPVPFFLDLRPQNFRWEPQSNTLIWTPSRLWFERSDGFRERVRNLYQGFFRWDSEKTRAGLELYAWEALVSDGYFSRVNALLNQHFGDANSKEVEFSISHFKSTFTLLFEETIRNRSRLHPELTFIGTALAGLYVTLEKIGTPLNVAKSFHSVARL